MFIIAFSRFLPDYSGFLDEALRLKQKEEEDFNVSEGIKSKLDHFKYKKHFFVLRKTIRFFVFQKIVKNVLEKKVLSLKNTNQNPFWFCSQQNGTK